MLTKDKYLTASELSLLTKHLRSDRNSLLIRLGLATGARANELLSIEKKDLSDGSVLIKGSKGSNSREIPLPEDLYKALLTLPEGRLFPISYPRLDQIWKLNRPIKKKFHSLRHTFAVNLYQKTRDIRLVQHALGHKSLTNTLIYAALVDSQEKLREALCR